MAQGCGLEQSEGEKKSPKDQEDHAKQLKGTKVFWEYLKPAGWVALYP
jgi:hypothetical protein